MFLGAAEGDFVDQGRDILLIHALLRVKQTLSPLILYFNHRKHDLTVLHALPFALPQQQDHSIDLVAHPQRALMQLPVHLQE